MISRLARLVSAPALVALAGCGVPSGSEPDPAPASATPRAEASTSLTLTAPDMPFAARTDEAIYSGGERSYAAQLSRHETDARFLPLLEMCGGERPTALVSYESIVTAGYYDVTSGVSPGTLYVELARVSGGEVTYRRVNFQLGTFRAVVPDEPGLRIYSTAEDVAWRAGGYRANGSPLDSAIVDGQGFDEVIWCGSSVEAAALLRDAVENPPAELLAGGGAARDATGRTAGHRAFDEEVAGYKIDTRFAPLMEMCGPRPAVRDGTNPFIASVGYQDEDWVAFEGTLYFTVALETAEDVSWNTVFLPTGTFVATAPDDGGLRIASTGFDVSGFSGGYQPNGERWPSYDFEEVDYDAVVACDDPAAAASFLMALSDAPPAPLER
jgi:hypothetical protein